MAIPPVKSVANLHGQRRHYALAVHAFASIKITSGILLEVAAIRCVAKGGNGYLYSGHVRDIRELAERVMLLKR